MKPTFKEKLKEAWPKIQAFLIEQLKGKLVQAVLVKILGSAALGGFRTWLIKFAVEKMYEQIAEPIIKAGLIKVGYVYHRVEGNILVEKLKTSIEEHNEDDYNSTIGDILN